MIPGQDTAQARLTVDLDALKANWHLLAERVKPAECAAVVKADAYGLGIDRAVPALARAGCKTFFVAHLGEGVRARIALRAAGFGDDGHRIFLLHGLQPGAVLHPDLVTFWLGPVLNTPEEIAVWAEARMSSPQQPPSAIQIDTGMNRVGLSADERSTLPSDLVEASGATLLISHFVAAEERGNYLNAAQIAAFEAARTKLPPGLSASLANSSGCFLPQQPFYDLVRPGYALYGGNPCPDRDNPMRPVVQLSAAILQTRVIAMGATVGYNGRWTAQRASRLATIGVGYADGVPRGARTVGSGDGPFAMLGQHPCPWVGQVSMDLSVIDVTDAPTEAAQPGASVVLLGDDISIDLFGAQTGTIGYEILTNLGRRYHRSYIESEFDARLPSLLA